MNTPETQSGSSLQRVVSVLFGELKLSGCENHPHRLDLSCCKIRQTDGTALTTKQVWEVLNELATAKHANTQGEAQPPAKKL
jgi:hypothetical protein